MSGAGPGNAGSVATSKGSTGTGPSGANVSFSSISPTTARKLVAGVVAFLLVSLAIVRTSDAAFTAQTTTDDISFTTGNIDLDNSATTPLFDESNLIPGNVLESNVLITYTGSVGTDDLTAVDLAVNPGPDNDDLLDHLEVAMSVTDACGDAPTYGTSGPLAALGGSTGWTPDEPSQERCFHFQVTVGTDAPQNATADDISLPWSLETTG
jgi:hypothetical protein